MIGLETLSTQPREKRKIGNEKTKGRVNSAPERKKSRQEKKQKKKKEENELGSYCQNNDAWPLLAERGDKSIQTKVNR